MRILVDADACPVKDLLLRAAYRLQVELVVVSNKPMAFQAEPGVTAVIVAAGPDEADKWIADSATPLDLVVTADIPLAAAVVEKGAIALGHRGEIFDEASMGDRLANWALHRQLRDEGLELSGPKPYGTKDRAAFSNAFDKVVNTLARKAKRGQS